MRSQLAARATTATLAIAPLLLVTACGATRPATAGPASPRAGVTAQSASQTPPAASASPTSGTIAISDEIRKACGIADEDAYFAFDSSVILSTDVRPLDVVEKCFTVGQLKGRALRLIGHADPRGATDYNMTLGQARADSVEQYLDRHGVRPSELGATSRGALDATGQDEVGWARDRRVDVILGS